MGIRYKDTCTTLLVGMQAKNMATPKKINPNAQAPRLIRKIQKDLGWTQTQLERFLHLSQQTVSNYLAGVIGREQHNVIQKLELILAKKLPPPLTEGDLIDDQINDGSTTSGNEQTGKESSKATRTRTISPRRNEVHPRKRRSQK